MVSTNEPTNNLFSSTLQQLYNAETPEERDRLAVCLTQPDYDNLGWIASSLAQVNMPLRKPKDNPSIWMRENGSLRLTVEAGEVFNVKTGKRERILPYGKIARAGLLYIFTEAKRTNTPKIELGSCQRDFMERLGFEWGGSQGRRLREQIGALAGARFTLDKTKIMKTMSADEKLGYAALQVKRQFSVASETVLWFGDRAEEQEALFPSFIVASADLMKMAQHSMPIDLRAWKYLNKTNRSPFVLDVYVWLAERAHRAKPQGDHIPWEYIQSQVGSTDKNLNNFKRTFLRALDVVKKVYPDARIQLTKTGVVIYSSPPAVEPTTTTYILNP